MHSKFLRALVSVFCSPLLLCANCSFADGMVQLNYSPVGAIFDDKNEFEFDSESYDKYEMEYDNSAGARILVDIYYLSYRHISAHMNDDIPDASIETYSIGLGCMSKYDLGNNIQSYALVGLGAGSGEFEFEDPDLNDNELLLEANFEIGLVLQNHITLGVGLEGQHFGSFSESMATSVSGYLSAGVIF